VWKIHPVVSLGRRMRQFGDLTEESNLLPIRIPIEKGILGYRLFIIDAVKAANILSSQNT
jgi:hypothetical protein